ncbi:uncharacterized protein LOC119453068 isoform X11 [Dermacentor silvarum]|uniref:uncharacterized protein LOC119453068 isoform X11 n=1 Tax=Dermacentor silvarum TaxID=543639 RepID=UPI002100AAEF|nr:uncharacterized protein LOC119453068 isoform X11 [Dermacentor silvarum]
MESGRLTAYGAAFKLRVVAYAEVHGKRVAGRHFGVDEKCVRRWLKQKEVLAATNESREAFRGKACKFPELERELRQYVVATRKNGFAPSIETIRVKALAIARLMGIAPPEFKASRGWLRLFMKRNELCLRRRTTPCQGIPLGETLPAADGVKAQTVRVHRTGRSWPLVMCPHHSTSEAEALGVATADFSAVFPDIDFKQAAEVACDKPPFIEDSLVSTTCRVEPWRGLQDKCVGEYEAVLQHAERFCQTEHHITLVQCRKPQVSTCSVEVQADPWCQHHCGIGPIGVDLCET